MRAMSTRAPDEICRNCPSPGPYTSDSTPRPLESTKRSTTTVRSMLPALNTEIIAALPLPPTATLRRLIDGVSITITPPRPSHVRSRNGTACCSAAELAITVACPLPRLVGNTPIDTCCVLRAGRITIDGSIVTEEVELETLVVTLLLLLLSSTCTRCRFRVFEPSNETVKFRDSVKGLKFDTHDDCHV